MSLILYVFKTIKDAACTSEAAPGSLVQCLVWCFLLFLVVCVLEPCQAKYVCSWQKLINWGLQFSGVVTEDFHRANNIPMVIAALHGLLSALSSGGGGAERKQRRGCRAGLLARLVRQPHKPPIPSIFLTNARSIVHKIDEPQLLLASNNTIRDCRVIIISESWLHPLIPNAAVQLLAFQILEKKIHQLTCKSNQ